MYVRSCDGSLTHRTGSPLMATSVAIKGRIIVRMWRLGRGTFLLRSAQNSLRGAVRDEQNHEFCGSGYRASHTEMTMSQRQSDAKISGDLLMSSSALRQGATVRGMDT